VSYVLCFLSGIAFSGILLLVWSLCRASADADKLAQRINEKEAGAR
jgi:hypothetical protein